MRWREAMLAQNAQSASSASSASTPPAGSVESILQRLKPANAQSKEASPVAGSVAKAAAPPMAADAADAGSALALTAAPPPVAVAADAGGASASTAAPPPVAADELPMHPDHGIPMRNWKPIKAYDGGSYVQLHWDHVHKGCRCGRVTLNKVGGDHFFLD